ncbi:hypothetical protein L2E82_19280 [Cichorium intybus]|uniref:Uncharacterized protein n=1 Tax=Cichorium intybus TaxID=13427 RepID=A0ACB9FCL7_CICIN|nr:hypothetical protein L2E82_19280 [Cichorium intybus]
MLREHALCMILCVINRTVLGRKYFSESKDEKGTLTFEEMQEMLDEFSVLNAALNLGDWIPWMAFMDLQGYVKRMKLLCKRVDRFFEHVFDEHRDRMKDEREGFVARDMVDVLLKYKLESYPPSSFLLTMESPYWILLATAVSLLIFILLNYPQGTKKNLPPGPRPWPLIGNLNLIGPLPHQSLHNLSQTYGKLMYLKFGSFPVVIASSPEMARLFLKTHDHIFASRPLTAAGKYTSYNYQDILFSPFTDHWKQGRKIYLNEVFSTKRLDSSEYIRVQETHDFVSNLYASSGDPIVLKEHVLRMILCLISRTVLGRNYFSESKDEKGTLTFEETQEMLEEFSVLNAALNLGDWIPWIGFMDLQGYVKRMKVLCKRFDRFFEHVFDEHRDRMNDEREGFVARDMVDVLLKLTEDPNLEVKLNSDAVKGLTQLPGNMRCEDIKMEEVYGLSTKMKFPLIAVVEPRLPGHMYR